jgi:hypothetical protein
MFRAVAAEVVKLRGTLARRLCWVAPLVVVGLDVAMLLVRNLGNRPIPPPAEAWQRFASECLGLFTFLMLPLFITLQSALLAQLEHGERQWKHLLALPVPRGVHYAAKAVALLAMTFAALLFLVVFIEIGGHLLSIARPALGLRGSAPHAVLIEKAAVIFLISTCMIMIHTWVALRWSSFTVAVATGMSATVIGFLVGQSEYRAFYPWSMALQVLGGQEVDPLRPVLVALAGAGVALVLGLWDFSRREMG